MGYFQVLRHPQLVAYSYGLVNITVNIGNNYQL